MGRRPSLTRQIETAIDATFVNKRDEDGQYRSLGRDKLMFEFPGVVSPTKPISRHWLKAIGRAEEFTLSYASARTYRQSSCSFFNRMPDDMPPRWLRDWTCDLTQYGIDLMRSETLSDAYIEKTLSALRKLVAGGRLLGWIDERPDVLVPDMLYADLRRSPPRLGYRSPNAAAIRAIVAADPRDGADFARILDLIRATGLRRVEWSYLREDDLDRQAATIMVRGTVGKGGRERQLYTRNPQPFAFSLFAYDEPAAGSDPHSG